LYKILFLSLKSFDSDLKIQIHFKCKSLSNSISYPQLGWRREHPEGQLWICWISHHGHL